MNVDSRNSFSIVRQNLISSTRKKDKKMIDFKSFHSLFSFFSFMTFSQIHSSAYASSYSALFAASFAVSYTNSFATLYAFSFASSFASSHTASHAYVSQHSSSSNRFEKDLSLSCKSVSHVLCNLMKDHNLKIYID